MQNFFRASCLRETLGLRDITFAGVPRARPCYEGVLKANAGPPERKANRLIDTWGERATLRPLGNGRGSWSSVKRSRYND